MPQGDVQRDARRQTFLDPVRVQEAVFVEEIAADEGQGADTKFGPLRRCLERLGDGGPAHSDGAVEEK